MKKNIFVLYSFWFIQWNIEWLFWWKWKISDAERNRVDLKYSPTNWFFGTND